MDEALSIRPAHTWGLPQDSTWGSLDCTLTLRRADETPCIAVLAAPPVLSDYLPTPLSFEAFFYLLLDVIYLFVFSLVEPLGTNAFSGGRGVL